MILIHIHLIELNDLHNQNHNNAIKEKRFDLYPKLPKKTISKNELFIIETKEKNETDSSPLNNHQLSNDSNDELSQQQIKSAYEKLVLSTLEFLCQFLSNEFVKIYVRKYLKIIIFLCLPIFGSSKVTVM
jgi:hypothetical protein